MTEVLVNMRTGRFNKKRSVLESAAPRTDSCDPTLRTNIQYAMTKNVYNNEYTTIILRTLNCGLSSNRKLI